MTVTGRDNVLYRHGQCSGWSDYRYGSTPPPVTLAGPKPRPILRGKKRDHVVDRVTSILKTWQTSPFEREADLVHGLRAGLCMEGYAFPRAEAESARIVGEALSSIGAKRPSWAEGQPDYVEPRENCAWCGRDVPDERHVGVKARRYCSDICAKTAFEKAVFERRNASDVAYQAAYRMIARSRHDGRTCVMCGTVFRPVREAGSQRFCSQLCGTRHSAALRCEAAPSIDRRCECCGVPFKAKDPKARRCSKRCNGIVYKFAKGTPPARISPPVFDYVFRLAA